MPITAPADHVPGNAMVIGLFHAAINAADLTASLAFYKSTKA